MLLLYSDLFIIGACTGSFITCMAERTCVQLPLTGKLRSFCPHCYHRLRGWQLIPIIGILLQRGRCFDCGQPISWRSTGMELLCGLLLLVSFPVGQPASGLVLLFGYAALLFNSLTDYLNLTVYPLTLIPPALLGWWQNRPSLSVELLILLVLILSLYLLARFTQQFGLGDVDVLLLLTCLAPPVTVLTSLTLATLAAVLFFLARPRIRLPFVPFMTWGFIMCTQLPITL